VATVSRQRKRRSGRPACRPARETTADQADPIQADIGDRRMFVVGWTSGGAPYGVFEDEMDARMNDLDADGRDQQS
jgi:hypothetical protein